MVQIIVSTERNGAFKIGTPHIESHNVGRANFIFRDLYPWAYHESTGEGIDDTAITARVKHALGSDPIFKYDDVHVTTFKGEAQLSGFVVSKDAKTHAEELAKNIEGVKNVADNIGLRE